MYLATEYSEYSENECLPTLLIQWISVQYTPTPNTIFIDVLITFFTKVIRNTK